MQPKIISKPAFTVAGMRILTKPMTPEIPNLWQQFAPRIDEVAAIAEPYVSYGLMSYDQERNALDYMAGVSVTSTADLPSGMTTWEVAPATYAVFEATLATIGEAFGYVYDTWLPTADYQHAAAPYFERYGDAFDPSIPTSTLEIYIPVEKKA